MKTYRLQFSLPGVKNSPILPVYIEAEDENAALDPGFDRAFAIYSQFGAFQLDKIEELKEAGA